MKRENYVRQGFILNAAFFNVLNHFILSVEIIPLLPKLTCEIAMA
jgi:hypothetical protein